MLRNTLAVARCHEAVTNSVTIINQLAAARAVPSRLQVARCHEAVTNSVTPLSHTHQGVDCSGGAAMRHFDCSTANASRLPPHLSLACPWGEVGV